ncbi:MAG: putative metal-binding motif-containing protein [Deltaproteobacteria bacterium]|nr:putative metal-binding motif-containing protein [Deltaproteobacteria bacterium]
MRRSCFFATLTFASGLSISPALAIDPPHGTLPRVCEECHVPHRAPGATLTTVLGNSLLCRSCHALSSNPDINSWAPSQQAIPGASGSHHSWEGLAVNSTLETQAPLDPALRVEGTSPTQRLMCSSCHDQHLQLDAPPDPSAPAYGGPGTGAGRHYQRVENRANQACRDCHRTRDVTSSSGGSHPVRVSLPSSEYRAPTTGYLVDGLVECTSCHGVHRATSGGANGGTGDGYLLNQNVDAQCADCHTLGDAASASHLSSSTGALWPGGQYGSARPAAAASSRGYCVNCHWPHGQPDDNSPVVDYPKLLVERADVSAAPGGDSDDAEDLCATCHDGSPAVTNIAAEFSRGTNSATNVYHHPVKDSEQALYGRSVECDDCHNAHRATPANPLAGTSGVDLRGDAVGWRTANPREISEYELCFGCHADTRNAGMSTTNLRLDLQANNSAFHPVAAPGKNGSAAMTQQLLGGLTTASTLACGDCHNNPATRYVNGTSTPYALGKASSSNASPKGPHGATNQNGATSVSKLLRANLTFAATPRPSYSSEDSRLCFLCHDEAKLVTASNQGNGARTNFDDGGNLHELHMVGERTTCLTCHFDSHANRQTGAEGSSHSTQYRITIASGTTVYSAGPPAGVKTRNVSFSPSVSPRGTNAKPEFQVNATNRQRGCAIVCHGKDHNPYTYTPSATYDNDGLTYTLCTDGDGDGYPAQTGCGSTQDCNDANGQVYPGAPEDTAPLCSDSVDNDCDTATDCAEAACRVFPWCPCTDADNDTYFAESYCGAQDCNDFNALIHPGVVENTDASCSDTADNDCDGGADCQDVGCRNTAPCPCTDADADNYFVQTYCGTAADCLDTNGQINPGSTESSGSRCNDGLDNDCDGSLDCAEASCQAPTNYTNEASSTQCTNGGDNDGDGLTDCHDRSCWSSCSTGSGGTCIGTSGTNGRDCCLSGGIYYACYLSACNGRSCSYERTCNVY